MNKSQLIKRVKNKRGERSDVFIDEIFQACIDEIKTVLTEVEGEVKIQGFGTFYTSLSRIGTRNPRTGETLKNKQPRLTVKFEVSKSWLKEKEVASGDTRRKLGTD